MSGDTDEPGQLNINEIANQPGWDIEIRTTEDRLDKKYRLKQQAADASFERWKDLALFGSTLVGVFVIGSLCISVVTSPGPSTDDKKWATSILTAIVSGGVGYLTGKTSK